MPDENLQSATRRLTRREMNVRGGCQCKLPGVELEDLLVGAYEEASRGGSPLIAPNFPEDCAIVKVSSTPADLTVLHRTYANSGGGPIRSGMHCGLAHNDIYASGGAPRWALVNLVVHPEKPDHYAHAVMTGILRACATEGVNVVGGHTVVGPEAMAGLTVLGLPQSDRLLTKKGALPGDILMLSKPLGVGLILRGYKLGLLDEQTLARAVSVMTTSNASASAAAVEAHVHASTDVSGFGMLGSLCEMLMPDLGAILDLPKIPVLLEPSKFSADAALTSWIESNYQYVKAHGEIRGVSSLDRLLPLLDPQTNGGLLVSAPMRDAGALENKGFTIVGRVTHSVGLEIRE